MRRRPPHIVVTTPESLYILLGSESGRAMLATTRTVIVDEIHALAPQQARHPSGALARAPGGAVRRPAAARRPLRHAEADRGGRAFSGRSGFGRRRRRRLHHRRYRPPPRARSRARGSGAPLEAVMSAEVWEQVYRASRAPDRGASHHADLRQYPQDGGAGDAPAVRSDRRRARGRAPRQPGQGAAARRRAAAQGRQAQGAGGDRLARARHRHRRGRPGLPARLAALDRGVPAAGRALRPRGRRARPRAGCSRSRATSWWNARRCSTASRRGELDRLAIPQQPLDVLAQQIVAEVAAREWSEDELFALIRRAWPYRALAREDFAAVVTMLAEGFSTRRGRRGALIHHDAVNHMLRGRRGARLTALTSGGTIPDNADYQVLLEPENHVIGTVNEDFAVESLAGDIFQLGNKSYRILRVERGVVRVEDAHGMAPTIPFWLGEAPGRSDELSVAVSRLRADMAARLRATRADSDALALAGGRARRRRARRRATGRISRRGAWRAGLPADAGHDRARALLRRGRRHAAGHPFALWQPHQPRLGPGAAQALLPQVQFRAAGGGDRGQHRPLAHHRAQLRARRGLALPAFRHRPAPADPGAARCADVHHALALGDRRRAGAAALPRRPEGAAAARAHGRRRPDRRGVSRPDRLRREPRRRARGPGSSAGPPDHRRLPQRGDGHRRARAPARAASSRATSSRRARSDRAFAACARGAVGAALCLSRRCAAGGAPHPGGDEPALALAGGRIRYRPARSRGDRARAIAKPGPRPPMPTSCTMRWSGSVPQRGRSAMPEPGWSDWLSELAQRQARGAARAAHAPLWITAERLPQFQALWPAASFEPAIAAPAAYAEREWSREEALVEILRGRLEGLGPVTQDALAAPLGLRPRDRSRAGGARSRRLRHARALHAGSGGGGMVRAPAAGAHSPLHGQAPARRDRAGAARDFLRFLLGWQRVDRRRPDGRAGCGRYRGRPARRLRGAGRRLGERDPAGAARRLRAVLARRSLPRRTCRLDAAAAARGASGNGRTSNGRPNGSGARRDAGAHHADHAARAPSRRAVGLAVDQDERVQPSHRAQAVADYIRAHGASFFDELVDGTGLLRSQVEEALAELVRSAW